MTSQISKARDSAPDVLRGFALLGIIMVVTGSLNAAAAQWFIQSDRCSAPYSVSQGLAINHKGEVEVTQDHDGSIWIGGNTHLTSFADVEI